MRILFVNHSLAHLYGNKEHPIGGSASELGAWLHGLNAIGERAGVLVEKGDIAIAGGNASCDLIETYDSRKGLSVAKYFYSYIPIMLRAARTYQPDILVQSSSGVQTGLMAFVANRLRLPFAYRVASDADVDARAAERLRNYEYHAFQYGLRSASIFLCQNESQRTALRSRFPADRVSVIHNPFVDIRAAAPRIDRSMRKYVAWLGVFKSMKNLTLLSNIAHQLPHIQFRVAGIPPSTGMDQRTVDALASLKMLPNVQLVGYIKRNDVLDFLSGAVALLVTSDFEGFSNTYLEAFSVGTPVVARSQVDPDHIIATNELGATTNTAAGLTNCLLQIFDMKDDIYHVLSQRCIDYLRKHHSAPVKAKELINILQPIVDAYRAVK